VAGGTFSSAGGLPANNVGTWDGTSWSALGTGTNSAVFALTSHNGALIAGGNFTVAGGVSASGIAMWDGTSWSALGTGLSNAGFGYALLSVGSVLYVGGSFVTAGGVTVNNIAAWDGTSWSALGSGTNSTVRSLTSFEGAVIAGGAFTQAGGIPAYGVARWDGTSWSAVGNGFSTATVYALAEYNHTLIATGSFTQTRDGATVNNIARWDGTSWSALGTGLTQGDDFSQGLALTTSGNYLYVAGRFSVAGGKSSYNTARWIDSLIIVAVPPPSPAQGGRLSLAAVRPNPSRGSMALHYVLPRTGSVRLTVVDASGRLVATLVQSTQAAGAHEVAWRGRDARGRNVRPGVYYARLATAEGTVTQKMVRVR
jgi:hypothetical protein